MMTERLATWDDEREAEKGREPFYVDRIRWRAQRRPFRLREQEADERDRQQEAAQLAAASKASEAFLAGLSGIGSGGELKAGEEGSAVKLSFAPTVAPKAKPAPATGRAPALMMSGDDEDDSKKKRALIPLTYSDDEDEDDVATTPAQRRRKIADKVPRDKTKLFTLPVQWDALNEVRPCASVPTSRALLRSLHRHSRCVCSMARLSAQAKPVAFTLHCRIMRRAPESQTSSYSGCDLETLLLCDCIQANGC